MVGYIWRITAKLNSYIDFFTAEFLRAFHILIFIDNLQEVVNCSIIFQTFNQTFFFCDESPRIDVTQDAFYDTCLKLVGYQKNRNFSFKIDQ